MRAEIIAIGSEILSGKTLNTNVNYLSKECVPLGLEVFYHTVVQDDITRLKEVLGIAKKKSGYYYLYWWNWPNTR